MSTSRMERIYPTVRFALAPILMLNLVSSVVLASTMQGGPGADVQATPSGIYIPLSIYISSLVAVAVATWTVARYDMSRLRRMDQLESTMVAIQTELEKARRARESHLL